MDQTHQGYEICTLSGAFEYLSDGEKYIRVRCNLSTFSVSAFQISLSFFLAISPVKFFCDRNHVLRTCGPVVLEHCFTNYTNAWWCMFPFLLKIRPCTPAFDVASPSCNLLFCYPTNLLSHLVRHKCYAYYVLCRVMRCVVLFFCTFKSLAYSKCPSAMTSSYWLCFSILFDSYCSLQCLMVAVNGWHQFRRRECWIQLYSKHSQLPFPYMAPRRPAVLLPPSIFFFSLVNGV